MSGCSVSDDEEYGAELARRYNERAGARPTAEEVAEVLVDVDAGLVPRRPWREIRAELKAAHPEDFDDE